MLRALVVLALLLVAVYLLRGPLLARPLGALVAGRLEAALGGDFAVAAVRGDWFSDLVLEGVETREEPEQGLLRRFEAERIVLRYGLWDLLTAPAAHKLDAVEAHGLVVAIARPPPDDQTPASDDPLAALARRLLALDPAELPLLDLAGRLELRDSLGFGAQAVVQVGGEAGSYGLELDDLVLRGEALGAATLGLDLEVLAEAATLALGLDLEGLALAVEGRLAADGRWRAEGRLTGLGEPLLLTAEDAGWSLAGERVDLALVPRWSAGVAGFDPAELPLGGGLALAANGGWTGERAELRARAEAVQLLGRELDRLELVATWDGAQLAIPTLVAEGLGSEFQVAELRLQPAAPWLVDLDRATLRSEDIVVVARLLELALPERWVPSQEAELALSARVVAGGRLETELALDSETLDARFAGTVGAELLSPRWREAALDLAYQVEASGALRASVEGALGGSLGHPVGALRLAARDLRYRDLRLETLELEAGIDGALLAVERCIASGPRFQARASGAYQLTTGRAIGVEAEVDVLDLTAVNAVLEQPLPVSGGGRLALRYDGRPWPLGQLVATGRGSLELGLADFGYAEHALPSLALALDFEPGSTVVETLDLTLPDGLALALEDPVALRHGDEGGWTVAQLALAAAGGTRISGSASGHGWAVERARLQVERAPVDSLAALPLELPELAGSWSGAVEVERFTGIPRFTLALETHGLVIDGVATAIEARFRQAEEVTIESLHLDAADGLELDLSGRLPWWVSVGSIQRRPDALPRLSCRARLPLGHPLVAPLARRYLPAGIAGSVALDLSCVGEDGVLALEGRVATESLRVGEDRFAGELRFAQGDAGLQVGHLAVDGSRGLAVSGRADLPLRLTLDGYQLLPGQPAGRLEADLPCEHPVLARLIERLIDHPVGGRVGLELALTPQEDHLAIAAALDSTGLTLAGERLELALRAHQDREGIRLDELRLEGAAGVELRGEGRLPLRWSRSGLEPAPGALRLALDAGATLDAPLLRALGPALGSGRVVLKARAGQERTGPPRLTLDLGLQQVRPDLPLAPEVLATLPAIDGGLELAAGEEGWSLAAEFDGPGELALALGGPTALELDHFVAWTRRLPTAPVSGSYRLSLPDLAWIAPAVPVITATAGSVRLAGEFGGTLAAPRWSGEGRIADVLVQNRSGFPTLSSGHGVFRLDHAGVVIERLACDLGYETAVITGRIPYDPRAQPLALAITGQNLLLYRDPWMNLRADLDCRLAGPLDALVVAGRVGITDLGYVRNFGLFSGGGGGGPPRVDLRPFALQGPILGAMRFDLRLRDGPIGRAREQAAAIRVRTNLLRADLELDLRLTGTGADPRPVGRLWTDVGKVFMPFGVYRVREAELVYPPDQPTNPQVSARATTRIQGYDVTVLVEGTMLDPRLEVTTSPYLDKRDAVLLATTGMLPSEVGAGGMAVSVAASYLGRELLNSVFTRGDGESGFFSEIQLDIATDDREGGIARARAEIPLEGRWYSWAEYQNTDFYEAYNGGFGLRFTPGRAEREVEDVDEDDWELPEEEAARGGAPRWQVEAPPGIPRGKLLAAAERAWRDFLRSGYDRAAAYDGAFAMEVWLQRQGYANARVTFAFDQAVPPQVVFRVEPGIRYRLADLRVLDAGDWSVIDSLSDPDGGLLAALPGVEPRYLKSMQVPDDEPYSAIKVDEIEQALARLYEFAGYREVATGPVLTSFDPARGEAYVDIVIAPGTRFVVRSVELAGTAGLAGDLVGNLRGLARQLRGGPYLERGLVLTQALLRDALANAGYLSAEVDYRASVGADGAVAVVFELDPGRIHLLRRVTVEWADTPPERRRTNEKYVKYKFTADTGQVLGQEVIDQGVRYLLGTGFLTEVSTRRVPIPPEEYRDHPAFHDLPPGVEQPEVVELVVTITEVPARTIDVELGAGSYDLLIGTIRYRDRNLFGSGRILEIAPSASFKGYSASIRLLDRDLLVKWLGPDHVVEYHAGWLLHEEPTFTRQRWEIGTGVHKTWTPHLSNRVGYTFVSEEATDIESEEIAGIDTSGFINNGTFSTGGRLEYRDLPAVPRSGWMADLGLAWSTPPFGSDLDYFELDAVATTVFDLTGGGGITLMLGGRYTNRDPLDNAPTLPIQYRLFNGGAGSVRSFPYNELAPVDAEGEALGGLSRGSATAELRLRFGDTAWHLAAFYDIGFVDARSYRMPDDFGQAVGGGIRYDLPVGPIRLDAAWGPGERFAADDDWAIHFAIGHLY